MNEWRTVFWVTFAVFVITTIVYLIWASGELQPWNEPESSSEPIENGTIDVKAIDAPPSFTATVLGADANQAKALEAAAQNGALENKLDS